MEYGFDVGVMELYEEILAERMSDIKDSGFCLEEGSMYGGNYNLIVIGKTQTEFINEILHY